MKANVTTSGRSSWQGLRNWTMAAALLPLVFLTGMARAQLVTNITIYQDNFARTGPLAGTAPDTANTPGATWFACNNPAYNAVLQTDGSEIALTNTPGTTNGLYLNGFLPFTPQVGHFYTLSAKIVALSGGSQWLAMGFATQAKTNNFFAAVNIGAAWTLIRGNGSGLQAYESPGGGTTTTAAAAFGTTTNLFKITLDTTTGNANYGWTLKFYTNATQVVSYAIPYNNYPIKYVGIGADAAQGYFQQFTLTDVLMRQGAPMISEQPQNTTAQTGRTATFWVAATNDYPAAAYQWMTNGASGLTNAIAGATNAVYTTPSLDMSYNGLNYSVIITNALGSTNSATAALTVVSGPPTVYSATKTANTTNVVVAFSKAVDPVTGLNPANYSLNINGAPGGVSILSASYGSASNNVILTTSTLNTNAGYYLTVQNVRDLFGNAMSGTANVPVLPNGMVFYVRADSGVVYDNSGLGLVTQWLDQTTNGNNATQFLGVPTAGINSSAARPTTNTINGRLALSFGIPVKSFLLAPDAPSLDTLISNTTMYAVVNFTTASGNEIVNKTWGNLPAPFDWAPGSGETVQYGNGFNNAPASGTGGTLLANTPSVVTSMLAFPTNSTGTTNFNFFLNGAANGNGAIRGVTGNPRGIYDGGRPLWVGGRWDLVNGNMKGQIAEIMLFNTALSGADLTNVDNYLGQKYFPYTVTQDLPPSTTSSNGFTVTYTFGASLGSVHGFSFQWQENGTNIPGATGATYTTPVLGPGDNGETYDVAVNLPNGSTTNSTTNTLTVLNVPPTVAQAGIPIWSITGGNTSSNVLVIFDEAAMDPATATVAANYSLNNGASVLSAAMGDTPNRVVLTTSALAWNENPGNYTLTVQNVQDIYGNTMVPASPSVGLYPPAVLWVRADAGVTTDSGTNTVNEWDDQSGNGNNLYQAAGGNYEPLLITNASGDVVLQFRASNGITNYMYAGSSPTLAITGDMSVIAVMSFTNLSNGQSGEIVSKTGNSAAANKSIAGPYDYYMGNGNATLYRGNANGTANGVNYGAAGAAAGSLSSLNRSHVVAVSEAGNTVSHFVDGRLEGTGLLSDGFQEANDYDGGNALFIGMRWDTFNNLKGSISEMIIVPESVTYDDIQFLDTYLAAEHHFPLFETNQTSMTLAVTNGQTTLSWPVDHTGWLLQSNSIGLTATGAWSTVAGSTATNQVLITPNAGQTNVFYRLFYPAN